MIRTVVALGAVAALAAGCGGTRTVTETRTVTAAPRPGRTEFGHIASLTRRTDDFELRFDPAWFLSGETASDAAAADGAIEKGQPVPNDNYVVDEGHRLLTYSVQPDARVTVLAGGGGAPQPNATSVSVAELAKIVGGTSSVRLFEPLDTGVWITVDDDDVSSIEQQYRP